MHISEVPFRRMFSLLFEATCDIASIICATNLTYPIGIGFGGGAFDLLLGSVALEIQV